MIYYKSENHKVLMQTKSEQSAKDYNLTQKCNDDELEKAYDGCWYEKGYTPQPSIEEQNEQIRQQRQARYVVESDPLRFDYDETLAREQDNAEQLKQEWLASKDKIREELPYIVGEEDETSN